MVKSVYLHKHVLIMVCFFIIKLQVKTVFCVQKPYKIYKVHLLSFVFITLQVLLLVKQLEVLMCLNLLWRLWRCFSTIPSIVFSGQISCSNYRPWWTNCWKSIYASPQAGISRFLFFYYIFISMIKFSYEDSDCFCVVSFIKLVLRKLPVLQPRVQKRHHIQQSVASLLRYQIYFLLTLIT